MPVSGVFRFGLQTLSDRFTYLPQIGLCVALAWAVADASRAWPLRPALCSIAAATLLAVLMRCAWWQTSFWHDDLTLWNHTLECTSQNRVAHLSLGNTYVRLGKLDKAIDQYREAIAIEPGYSMPHYNLGVAFGGCRPARRSHCGVSKGGRSPTGQRRRSQQPCPRPIDSGPA